MQRDHVGMTTKSEAIDENGDKYFVEKSTKSETDVNENRVFLYPNIDARENNSKNYNKICLKINKITKKAQKGRGKL